MKKLIYLLFAGCMILSLTACGKKAPNSKAKEAQKKTIYDEVSDEYIYQDEDTIYKEIGEKYMDQNTAVIKVKGYGEIEVELLSEYAPITVANFKKLIIDKFYDGLTFHRIIQGFMIQGGDPRGDGTGGSDVNIKGEFSSNGVENNLSHKRGVISMARSSFPNSASSQFFICDADDEFLDGNYAAFGRVTKGMDVVDKIAADAKVENDNDSVAPENQPKIESIRLK